MTVADEASDPAGSDLLPAEDGAWLDGLGLDWSAALDGSMLDIIVAGYRVPAGYDHDQSDLLIRLPASWPDGTPDMFWFDPPLRLKSGGGWPDRAADMTIIAGRTWQRWSRHIGGGWRSGVDGIGNYLAIIDRALVEAVS
jgi:E2/UBC family protein E